MLPNLLVDRIGPSGQAFVLLRSPGLECFRIGVLGEDDGRLLLRIIPTAPSIELPFGSFAWKSARKIRLRLTESLDVASAAGNLRPAW